MSCSHTHVKMLSANPHLEPYQKYPHLSAGALRALAVEAVETLETLEVLASVRSCAKSKETNPAP